MRPHGARFSAAACSRAGWHRAPPTAPTRTVSCHALGPTTLEQLPRLAQIGAHARARRACLDLDELPLAPLPGGDWVSQQLGHGRGADATPPFNNAAFAMTPGHPCVGALLEAADRTLRSCRFRTFWGMFGPHLLQLLFDPGWREALGSRPPAAECAGVARLPPHVFSPIRWNRAKSFYRVSTAFNASWLSQQAAAGTRALHLYTSNLGLKGPAQARLPGTRRAPRVVP